MARPPAAARTSRSRQGCGCLSLLLLLAIFVGSSGNHPTTTTSYPPANAPVFVAATPSPAPLAAVLPTWTPDTAATAGAARQATAEADRAAQVAAVLPPTAVPATALPVIAPATATVAAALTALTDLGAQTAPAYEAALRRIHTYGDAIVDVTTNGLVYQVEFNVIHGPDADATRSEAERQVDIYLQRLAATFPDVGAVTFQGIYHGTPAFRVGYYHQTIIATDWISTNVAEIWGQADESEFLQPAFAEGVTGTTLDSTVAAPPTAAPRSVVPPATLGCSAAGRTGAICSDGWHSSATGRGACSHHGGVDHWLCSVP